jgi:hypothetical protein
MRWAGHVARIGEKRCVQGFDGKPEGKRPLEDPCVDIKIDLQEVGSGACTGLDVAQDGDRCRALVNAVMNLRVP